MSPSRGWLLRAGVGPAVSHPAAAVALLWLVGLVAFWPALSGPWLLDDVKLLDRFEAIQTGGLPGLVDGGWKQHVFLAPEGTGRPLAMLSLAANRLVSSSPWGFKAVSLALHLLAGTLVYLLVRRLLAVATPGGDGSGGLDRTGAWAALAVALVWTLHPLQVSTVAYVVQRMTVLSALFSLWALLDYARLRMQTLGGGPPPRPWRWALPLAVLPALALGGKETGALTPVLLLVLEVALFRGRGPATLRRWLTAYFVLVLMAAFGALLWLLLVSDLLVGGYAGRAFDMGERLLTQCRVLVLYLGQVLLPRPGDMPFFYDGLRHSTGWLEPPATALAAALLAALAGLTLWLLKRRPLAAFGILFFFAGHLMESTLLPLELAFEHRNYLPSLGLLLAAADLLLAAGGALGRWRWAIGALAVGTLFGLTLLRASAWAHEEQIYVTALASPWGSVRARAQFAQWLTDQGAPDSARGLLREARGLGARLQEGYLDCRGTGALPAARLAEARAEMGPALTEYDVTALTVLANMALDGECRIPTRDLRDLTRTAAGAPRVAAQGRQTLWLYAGHLSHALGEGAAAEAALGQAFDAYRANPVPLLLAANWRLDAGDAAGARAYLERAREAPASARLNLAPLVRALEERLGPDGSGVTPP